jgi:hypothetical protein
MGDGETRDEETHGEGIHDATSAEAEDPHFQEQMIESSD